MIGGGLGQGVLEGWMLVGVCGCRCVEKIC